MVQESTVSKALDTCVENMRLKFTDRRNLNLSQNIRQKQKYSCFLMLVLKRNENLTREITDNITQ